MPNATGEVTAEDLEAFADAWNRHDLDALMSFMTEDCVFDASAGPEVCGTRPDGTRIEVNGCDVFTFREGKIVLKNSYRKNRPTLV